MPEKETLERAKKDKREGKAPTTQAGEFVREEIEHIREGKHGARSTQQAITIVPRASHLFEEPGTLEDVARLASAWFDRHLRRKEPASRSRIAS